MKRYLSFFLAIVSSLSNLMADTVEVKAIFDLNKVAKYAFVEEVSVGDTYAYKKLGEVKEANKQLKHNLSKLIKSKDSTEIHAPGIGVLTNVLLIDDKDNPVCAISVINFDRTIVLRDVKKIDGNLIIGDTRIELRSDPMSRWIYELFKVKFPKKYASQQAFYKPKHTIEGLLFPEPDKTNKANKSQ